MTSPDDAAMDALRRLDRPHAPDPVALDRIEAAMLARFDAAAAAEVADTDDARLIDLRPSGDESPSPRTRVGRWLLAAAALVAVVAGAIVLTSRSDETETPATTPSTTVDETALVTEQLRVFCAEYVEPLGVAVVRMGTDTDGEAVRNVLLAVEQATQGIVDLPNPAASRFTDVVEELDANAVAARREETLRSSEIRPLQTARDALYDAIAAVPETAAIPECARP